MLFRIDVTGQHIREKWTFSGDAPEPWQDSLAARSTRSLKAEDIGYALQPIVSLDSGRLFAAEVLVRCKWPEYKSPPHLFEVAVQEKSVGRLGRTIRDVAFASAPSIPLFVNLHPHELSSRWLVRPDDPINFHDSDVYLEITESATFDHFDLVMGTLKELCSRSGARLVIDDMGAGYSNLKRMIELEPAVVKLDRELVCGIHKNLRQQKLVRHMVELCEDLGATVVAEGIETVGELRVIRELGCHFGQGFLLAMPGNPMPPVVWPLAELPLPARRLAPPPKPSHPALAPLAAPPGTGAARQWSPASPAAEEPLGQGRKAEP